MFVLVGDGECQEGTVWEAANVARNRRLGNLCVIVDWNQSAMQLMPIDDMPRKWEAFGWNVQVVDGHNEDELINVLQSIDFKNDGIPTAIVAKTIKGKGVPMLEGHGIWHHRIPNKQEYREIMGALS
jgi:transketolase